MMTMKTNKEVIKFNIERKGTRVVVSLPEVESSVQRQLKLT